MKAKKLISFCLSVIGIQGILILFASAAWSLPVVGIWHYKSMYCESSPETSRILQPILFSKFKPNFFLVLQTDQDTPHIENNKQISNVEMKKIVGASSCSKPISPMMRNSVVYQQTYFQKMEYANSELTHGFITGVKLGDSWESENVSVFACDSVLGTIKFIFGLGQHLNEELSRVYEFAVSEDQRQLSLSYQEITAVSKFASPCGWNERTVLNFEKISK